MNNKDKLNSNHQMKHTDLTYNNDDDSTRFGNDFDDDSRRLRNDFDLTERLTHILVDDTDTDLVIEHGEDRVMQLLQALDTQVLGACRVDDRMNPLLQLNNVSDCVAEDRMLAPLSQV